MKPSVGRIIHYVEGTGEHAAGIITKVWSDTVVNVTLFPTMGPLKLRMSVEEDSAAEKMDTWHWPERVD